MTKNKKYLKKILFFGRENCEFSDKIKKYLENNSQSVHYIKSKKKNQKLNIQKLKNKKFDFIFSYRSFFILKKKLINQSKFGAINFHPGTPNFRGIGAVNFAIYKNSNYYGCTAHYINEKIDSGKIIDVTKFKLKKEDGIDKILKKTHKTMYLQAMRIIKNCLKDNNFYLSKRINYKWSKRLYTSEDLEKLYNISTLKNKSNLGKIIEATYSKKFKPYLKIRNQKYFLVKNDKNI